MRLPNLGKMKVSKAGSTSSTSSTTSSKLPAALQAQIGPDKKYARAEQTNDGLKLYLNEDPKAYDAVKIGDKRYEGTSKLRDVELTRHEADGTVGETQHQVAKEVSTKKEVEHILLTGEMSEAGMAGKGAASLSDNTDRYKGSFDKPEDAQRQIEPEFELEKAKMEASRAANKLDETERAGLEKRVRDTRTVTATHLSA